MSTYDPDDTGLCRTCGGEVPHHDTTAHRLAPELARLRALLDEAGNVLCGDEPKRPVWELLEDIDAALTPEAP
jgi:hypothetical protein